MDSRALAPPHLAWNRTRAARLHRPDSHGRAVCVGVSTYHHPASDHLRPRWAGLSWLCPQLPGHPPALPQGGEQPTQCLPSWGLQGPLVCPISHTLSPSCLSPHPSGTKEKCVLTGSPSLPGAPSFPGGPAGPGGPCGPGTARAWGLCTTEPARPCEEERARLGGHTHAYLPTPPHSCVLGWVSATQRLRVDTHRGHEQAWTCTGFGLVTLTGACPVVPYPCPRAPRALARASQPCPPGARRRDTEEGYGLRIRPGHQ